MSGHIASVTEQDHIGVIEKAAFDAKAIVTEQTGEAGAVAAAENKALGQEAEEHARENSGKAPGNGAASNKATAEGELATSMAEDAVLPAAVQVSAKLVGEISKSDPAQMDAGRLAKQTGGMSTNVKTMEDIAKSMKTGGKLGSFKSALKGSDLGARAEIGSGFLSGKGVQSGSKAASAELASLRQVKQAVYGHRLASEQKLTQAQVALERKGPQIAQAQQTYGMAGPGMGLGSGPKFKPPKEGDNTDIQDTWA